MLTTTSPAELSNTAGPNRHEPESGGVDTLEVSIYGGLTNQGYETQNLFDRAKQSAQNGGSVLDSVVTISGRCFVVGSTGIGKGKAHLHYTAQWDGITIALRSGDCGSGERIAAVRIGAVKLLRSGHQAAWQEALDMLDALGVHVTESRVHRIDLCVDCPYVDVEEFCRPFVEHRWISRVRKHETFGEGRRFTGISVGTEMKLRIYDKLAELNAKEDTAKFRLMVEHRWGGEVPPSASRVEFQIRRKALRDNFNVSSVEETFAKLATITNYLTTEWFRLVVSVDRENGNQKRAKNELVWDCVITSFEEWTGLPPAPREKRIPDAPAPERLVRQAIGCMISTAAAVLETFESEDQLLEFFGVQIKKRLPDYWRDDLRSKKVKRRAAGELPQATDQLLEQEVKAFQPDGQWHDDDCFCEWCVGEGFTDPE